MRFAERRILAAGLILLCLLPIGAAGVNHTLFNDGIERSDGDIKSDSLALVSYQGGEVGVGGGVVLVDRETNKVVWSHTEYVRYFDVDPLSDGRLMVVAGNKQQGDGRPRFATIIDWQSDTVIDRFYVQRYTHDVDYIGDNEYAIADLLNSSAYVYNRTTDEIVWKWRFRDHFPNNTGGGSGGYTHLNDIDAVDNGSAFLLSPRNFDRVILVDRTTGNVVWTLGAQDQTNILYEQHNPALLQQDPPTVLVADSENNRVIEYQKSERSWEPVWSYQGHAQSSQQDLHWPRDADRLPSGNTIIADTGNDRVLEVTPGREVVWQFRHNNLKAPYDVEIVHLGDEPTGPTMAQNDEFDQALVSADESILSRLSFVFAHSYFLAQWILPVWFTRLHFGLLLVAVGVATAWLNAEITNKDLDSVEMIFEKIEYSTLRSRLKFGLGGLATLAGFVLLLIELFPDPEVPRELYIGSGFVLLLAGVLQLRQTLPSQYGKYLVWPIRILRTGAIALSVLLLYLSLRGGDPVITDVSIAFAILLLLVAFDTRE